MKQYIGTKVVKAKPMTYGGAYKAGLVPENSFIVEYSDNEGYFVEYQDGYQSWSPKIVFEDAYRPIEVMDFSQALLALKAFKCIRRKGWNGKNLMVFRQVPAHITSDIIPKMQSVPDDAKRLILETAEHIDYTSQCLIYNMETGCADSWVPSVSDLMAEDWEVIE